MDIEVSGVTVRLGTFVACRNVDVSMPSGSVTGIVGPNGAGKTSLLRCLYRAVRPDDGSITVSGDDLWELHQTEAARRIAAVMQEQSAGFDLTVRDVVSLGRIPHRRVWQRLDDGDRTIVDSALQRVDLQHLAHRHVAELSGGERQRVVIARSLAQQAKVLVLDEPTNHLDIWHQLGILELVCDLGITVVVALHDLTLADRHCDQIIIMRTGEVVAAGPTQTTLTPANILKVFGVHAEAFTTADGRRTFAYSKNNGPTE